MIIKGNFETLDSECAFELRDENGKRVMGIERNEYISNKVLVKNPDNGTVCMGTISNTKESDGFILLEGEKKILHIKQSAGLNLPKFDITSTFGEFTTKPVLRNREIWLLNGKDVVAKIKGDIPNYEVEIDDNSDAFYIMCVVFGMTTLMPMRLIYRILR